MNGARGLVARGPECASRAGRMRPLLARALAWGLVGLGAAVFKAEAREAGRGRGKEEAAPLGSLDFHPSPARPVGWRGDGTGRYPGAEPPTEWGRWVKSFVTDLRSRARKPAEDDAGGGGDEAGEKGEPLDMGELHEWLVLGPFAVEDVAKAMSEELVPDEAALEPDGGDTAGGKSWRAHRISQATQGLSYGRMVLDFTMAYDMREKLEWQNHPGTLDPLVAYAHTYVHSESGGRARLRVDGRKAVRAWLNGAPVGKSGTVELARGYNRLLVKAGSSNRAWHFSAVLSPLPPCEYETKNVAWMTLMPGKGWSCPIVVGERVLVGADQTTLVCVNKRDGKIMWARNNTFYHALDDAERAKHREAVGPLAAELDALTAEIVADVNAAVSPSGVPAGLLDALRGKIKRKTELEGRITKELRKADRKRFKYWDQHCGTANRTACSDGEFVFCAFMGGCKGQGADTVACYDLDGKEIWRHYTGPIAVPEHGDHASPLLVGDKLVYAATNTIYAFDKATGEVLWSRRIAGPPWTDLPGGSPVAARVNGVDVASLPTGEVFRVSDGRSLWRNEALATVFASHVMEGGVMYAATSRLSAVRLADVLRSPKAEPLYVGPKDGMDLPRFVSTYGNTKVASPLYVDGLIYVVTQGGGLVAADARSGRAVCRRELDGLAPRLTWVYVVGVCASPTLAGGHIYIVDDQSQTVVVEPGPECRQVARNALADLDDRGIQEQSESTPVFEGDRMYYRSAAYLYCIARPADDD